MLVFRRTPGQSFVIGDIAQIEVKVLRYENGAVIIGIDAPKGIPVDRLEIREKKMNEKMQKVASGHK